MFKIILISLLIAGVLSYDFECPLVGQHFFRYPYDCTKFVECNDGVSKLEDCIPGLFFSEKASFCDFPDNVECVVDEIPTGPGDCPAINGKFATFLPDKTDCTRYYECDWGVPILMHCPDGLYFNDELDVCDYPRASGCIQS